MKKSKLIICVGPSPSGKTGWASKKRNKKGWIRWDVASGPSILWEAIDTGKNVVIDSEIFNLFDVQVKKFYRELYREQDGE